MYNKTIRNIAFHFQKLFSRTNLNMLTLFVQSCILPGHSRGGGVPCIVAWHCIVWASIVVGSPTHNSCPARNTIMQLTAFLRILETVGREQEMRLNSQVNESHIYKVMESKCNSVWMPETPQSGHISGACVQSSLLVMLTTKVSCICVHFTSVMWPSPIQNWALPFLRLCTVNVERAFDL